MERLLSLGFVFSIFCLISVWGGCPGGWSQHENSCYKYMGDHHSFNYAKGLCEQATNNGKLVEMGSQGENDWVNNFAKQNGGNTDIWIGLTDQNNEGHFTLASHDGWNPIYTHWAGGEPNNYQNNEDCVLLKPSEGGQWHDEDCSHETSFVCEVLPDQGGNNNNNGGGGGRDGSLPFWDTNLSFEQRVDDLVGRLTLDEITHQLARGGKPDPAPHIDRLGIKDYQFWTGCNARDVYAPGGSTGFPQAIGLAATFSPDIRFRVAEATAIEVRAKHTQFMKEGNQGSHTGLSCFAPDLDIMKHPFWGRNQETHGECPYMSSVYADNFIRGLQGNHPRYARATAGCKHFAIHSGPEEAHNGGHDRKSFDSKASMADMRMTYLPAFRQCVTSGTYSMMSSYNAINGVPVAANHWLLTELLRNEWGFKGYVLADAGAIESLWWSFHYTNNKVDTVAASIKSGLNIETSVNNNDPFFYAITDAVHQGKLSEQQVRDAVKPLFYTRMKLGEFDPPNLNPYMSLGLDNVESQKHQDLAIEAAQKSFVLLKNRGALPLKNSHYNNIALVGPMGDAYNELDGDYASTTDWKYKTNVKWALDQISGNLHWGKGCDNVKCHNYNSGQVTGQLNGVDVIFVALGTGTDIEAESNDKFDYNLPGHQKQLLQDTLNHANGKPVILLLFVGSAIDISFAENDDRVSAIISGFFPSQGTGKALKNVLLNQGQWGSPAGRLPFTWYKSEHDLGDINDYNMDGKTYRYLHVNPLYPFGYGLSYTSFHYSDLHIPNSINAGQDLTGSFTVHNTGSYGADECVQVYISWNNNGLPAPKIQLAYFDRIGVGKGGTNTVHFKVSAKTMALWVNNKWKISGGGMKLYAGGQQPHQHKDVGSNVLEANFNINGDNHPNMVA